VRSFHTKQFGIRQEHCMNTDYARSTNDIPAAHDHLRTDKGKHEKNHKIHSSTLENLICNVQFYKGGGFLGYHSLSCAFEAFDGQ
jgi:hypothetical protein